MQFKLTKIELHGNSSVPLGSSSIGSDFKTLNFDTKEQKDTPSFSTIEIGDMIFIDGYMGWIKTSPISEIKEVDDSHIVFKTTSSIYELSIENLEEQSLQ